MNRKGIHSGEGNQLYANTRLSYVQTLSDTFTWGAGGELHARAGSEPVLFLNQGYLSLHGYGFSLKAGAFYNTSPFQNDREIGRASCRERVLMSVSAIGVINKAKRGSGRCACREYSGDIGKE